jgi:sucrose phosphorylase
LCEVHEEYKTNIALSLHGYWVYDFALPLLILHAFTFKTMDNLKHWLTICPRRQITVLDTHDGMGIDDIIGLAEVRTSLLNISSAMARCSGHDEQPDHCAR